MNNLDKLVHIIDKKWDINLDEFKYTTTNNIQLGYSVKCFKLDDANIYHYGIIQSIKTDPIFHSVQKITIYNPVEESQKTLIPRKYLLFCNKKIDYFRVKRSKFRKFIDSLL